jgi:hypothetical protein
MVKVIPEELLGNMPTVAGLQPVETFAAQCYLVKQVLLLSPGRTIRP